MQYRSRERILYQILSTLAKNKTTLQTHIMYECRLSYAQLKQYIEYMKLNNLVKSVDSALALTEEGRELLTKMEKVFSVKLTLPT